MRSAWGAQCGGRSLLSSRPGNVPMSRCTLNGTCVTIWSMADSSRPTSGAQWPVAPLTLEQQTWAEHSAALWQRARELARMHPEHDPSDLYHALRCLELAPAERLRAGLQRGRLRTYAR